MGWEGLRVVIQGGLWEEEMSFHAVRESAL